MAGIKSEYSILGGNSEIEYIPEPPPEPQLKVKKGGNFLQILTLLISLLHLFLSGYGVYAIVNRGEVFGQYAIGLGIIYVLFLIVYFIIVYGGDK